MRLFVGVKLSLEAVADVRERVDAMRAAAEEAGVPVRWVAPATYHVTLKFLGEARPEAVFAIRDAVGEALEDVDAFEFSPVGAGAFPSAARGRVVWIGVDDPAGGLIALASACDRALAPLGFPAEKRAFHPHVTVGRLRQVANVDPVVLACTEQRCSGTLAAKVTLFESQTKSTGSEYVSQATWPLRVRPRS